MLITRTYHAERQDSELDQTVNTWKRGIVNKKKICSNAATHIVILLKWVKTKQ